MRFIYLLPHDNASSIWQCGTLRAPGWAARINCVNSQETKVLFLRTTWGLSKRSRGAAVLGGLEQLGLGGCKLLCGFWQLRGG